MKYLLYATLTIFLMAQAGAASPGDSEEGKRLHDTNCVACHDAGVYTRKDRSVRSLDDLKQQFQSCGHMTKKEFSATETQSIVKYLNERFYQFR